MFVAKKALNELSQGLIINIKNLEPTFAPVVVSHCLMQPISLILAQDGQVSANQFIQMLWQLKWTEVILWFELRYFVLVVTHIWAMSLKMAQRRQVSASV